MTFQQSIVHLAKKNLKRVIFSESEDERILRACIQLAEDSVIQPILVGDRLTQEKLTKINPFHKSMEIIDSQGTLLKKRMTESVFDLRKHKGITIEDAELLVENKLVFANLCVKNNLADATINGAVYTTADVVKAAIQYIGLDKKSKLVSSYFVLSFEHQNQNKLYIFADCALVINPNTDQLINIATSTIKSAQSLLGDKPKVAMLSFSTDGSSIHSESLKVAEATKKIREIFPDVLIDGEIQFDAAITPTISKVKYKDSQIKGEANVFIFPNLSSANIGYKIVQRLVGATAIGPVLQGLAMPANDLSRGCSVDDIYYLSALTAVQAQ